MRGFANLAAALILVAFCDTSHAATQTKKFRDCRDCPEMIVIPPGAFMMGSPPGEPGRFDDLEGTQHEVTITHPFAMGVYLVTRGEYAKFAKETARPAARCVSKAPDAGWQNPGFKQSDRDPVVCVSWDDAQAYVAWLNAKLRKTNAGGTYRLPTESEWEYAARAWTSTAFYWGDEVGRGHANCKACGDPRGGQGTTPVDTFPPNFFGLFDMAGNAFAWVEDCWHPGSDGAPADGSARVEAGCAQRVARGGAWMNDARVLRHAFRSGHDVSLRADLGGFRVARRLH